MSIVSVRVSTRGDSREERVSHVMGEEILQFPSQFIQLTNQLACDLLGGDHVRITYMDSEGDSCTLTEETVKDALCFTKPGTHEDQPRVLELEVSLQEEMPATLPSKIPETQDMKTNDDPAEVATHSTNKDHSNQREHCWGRHGKRHWSNHHSVVCDGCGQNPISGTRYQSQEWHDYDLCAQCHERSDRAEVLGVLPNHKFNVIEPNSRSRVWIDGLLDRLEQDPTDFFQKFMPMVNVQEMVPKLAQVAVEVVAAMDKEELFPLLDPLTSLAEQNPLDIQGLPAQLRVIVAIIRAAPQQIQDELKQKCMAGGMRLFCSSGGAAGSGHFHHPRWLKGMFKGMFKGKGKGMFAKMGKGMCKGKSENIDDGEWSHHWGKGMFKGKGEDAGEDEARHHWATGKGWGCHSSRGGWKGKGFGKGMWHMFSNWGQQNATANAHHGITCDGCEKSPVAGIRYRSLEWPDYDLCENCHGSQEHRTTLGVTPEHSFEAIPPAGISESGGTHSESPADGACAEKIEACLTFLQSFGVDLRQTVPNLALKCLTIVQDMGKDELFPLLDPLASLAQQENPDMHSLAGPAATIFETIKSAPPGLQQDLMMRIGQVANDVLAEVSAEAAMLVQTLMAQGAGPSGCGKGWGGKCGKGWGKRSWSSDGGRSSWWGGCAKRARHEESSSSLHDAAMSTLLAHPDAKIREAAQQALQQAADVAATAATAATANSQPSPEGSGLPYKAPMGTPPPYVESAVPLECPKQLSAVLHGEPALELHSDSIVLAPLETRDVTNEWSPILSNFPSMKQAFLLGRVFLDRSASDASVMAVHLVLGNSGNTAWPAGTALRIAAGHPFGCEQVTAGEVPVGAVLEITLKLNLPCDMEANRSAWALECNGEPFGPMIILEVMRT